MLSKAIIAVVPSRCNEGQGATTLVNHLIHELTGGEIKPDLLATTSSAFSVEVTRCDHLPVTTITHCCSDDNKILHPPHVKFLIYEGEELKKAMEYYQRIRQRCQWNSNDGSAYNKARREALSEVEDDIKDIISRESDILTKDLISVIVAGKKMDTLRFQISVYFGVKYRISQIAETKTFPMMLQETKMMLQRIFRDPLLSLVKEIRIFLPCEQLQNIVICDLSGGSRMDSHRASIIEKADKVILCVRGKIQGFREELLKALCSSMRQGLCLHDHWQWELMCRWTPSSFNQCSNLTNKQIVRIETSLLNTCKNEMLQYAKRSDQYDNERDWKMVNEKVVKFTVHSLLEWINEKNQLAEE